MTGAVDRLAAFREARRPSLWSSLVALLVVVTGLAIVTLLVVVLWLGFYDGQPGDPGGAYTFKHYAETFVEFQTYRVLINTLWFSLSSLFVAVLFGLPPAWLVERTNLPGKTVVRTMMTIGLLIPGFADAMGWVFLLHPRIGLINLWLMELFGLSEPLLNIGTIIGMGWVQGLNLAPVVFIMTAAVFRAMDPSLEEAAQMSGADVRSTLRRITLAVSWPGIAAALIYVFTIGFAAFDVPAIIGWGNRLYTFSTYLVVLVSPDAGAPRYGPAAALSTFVIVVAGLLSWWYNAIQARAQRFAVVTGRGYRPRIIALNRWVYSAWAYIGLYLCLSKIFPIVVLLWASVLPFFQLPSASSISTISMKHYESLPWQLVWSAFGNTSLLMVLTPTIVLVVSLAFSWVRLRTRIPGRGIVDFIAFLPHAVPNIVFGIGALLLVLFALQMVVPLYGTIWVILIIFVIARVSYGTRMTNSALIQIHPELEESARVGGANTDEVLRRILIPLLRPTFVYAWLWIALLSYRELTLSVVLTVRDNMTAPVLIWHLWMGGGLGPAAALSIVLMLLILPVVILYWLIAQSRRAALL